MYALACVSTTHSLCPLLNTAGVFLWLGVSDAYQILQLLDRYFKYKLTTLYVIAIWCPTAQSMRTIGWCRGMRPTSSPLWAVKHVTHAGFLDAGPVWWSDAGLSLCWPEGGAILLTHCPALSPYVVALHIIFVNPHFLQLTRWWNVMFVWLLIMLCKRSRYVT